MPIEWAQVNARLRLDRFNIKTAAKRMREHGDPLRAVLKDSCDMIQALQALQQRLAK
jgi:DNA primase